MCDCMKGFAEAIRIARANEEALHAAGCAALAIADLASAQGITIEEAAAIMRGAQERYGLDTEQMANIAEVLAGARRATPIDPSEMGNG